MKKLEIGTRIVLAHLFGEGRIEGRIVDIPTDFEIEYFYHKVYLDESNYKKLHSSFQDEYKNHGCIVVHEKNLYPIICRLNRKAR